MGEICYYSGDQAIREDDENGGFVRVPFMHDGLRKELLNRYKLADADMIIYPQNPEVENLRKALTATNDRAIDALLKALDEEGYLLLRFVQ